MSGTSKMKSCRLRNSRPKEAGQRVKSSGKKWAKLDHCQKERTSWAGEVGGRGIELLQRRGRDRGLGHGRLAKERDYLLAPTCIDLDLRLGFFRVRRKEKRESTASPRLRDPPHPLSSPACIPAGKRPPPVPLPYICRSKSEASRRNNSYCAETRTGRML